MAEAINTKRVLNHHKRIILFLLHTFTHTKRPKTTKNKSKIKKRNCNNRGSNLRPRDLESDRLPTDLTAPLDVEVAFTTNIVLAPQGRRSVGLCLMFCYAKTKCILLFIKIKYTQFIHGIIIVIA